MWVVFGLHLEGNDGGLDSLTKVRLTKVDIEKSIKRLGSDASYVYVAFLFC